MTFSRTSSCFAFAARVVPSLVYLVFCSLAGGCRGYSPRGDADASVAADASSPEDAAPIDARPPDGSAGETDAVVAPPVFLVSGGGIAEDVANGIAADSVGNVFLTGFLQYSASFDGTTKTSEGLRDGFVSKYSSQGDLLWMHTLAGGDYQSLASIALDSNENVLVCGYSSGVATLDGSQMIVGDSGYHGVVIALSNGGDYLWSVATTGASSVEFRSLAIDSGDMVHVTGSYRETLDLAGTVHVSEGNADILLLRINSSGQVVWATSAGGADYDVGIDVGVGPSGDAWVTGLYIDQASFDGTVLEAEGMNDAFVARYGADGALRWASTGGGTDWDGGFGIAVGDDENSVMVGYITYDATFAGTHIVAGGWEDVIVAGYAPDGGVRWVRRAGSETGDERAHSVVLDALGNAYVTGFHMGQPSDFGNYAISSNGWEDIFLALYDRNGEVIAARSVGSDDWDAGLDLHLHTDGVLYVAGFFKNTAHFDSASAMSFGSFDVFGWGTTFP